MKKIYETSSEIAELVQKKFDETSLPQMAIELKLISTTKSKNVLKVSKSSATVQYLTKKDVLLVIYEDAFDRLSDEYKEKLLEGALSNIEYDIDKDKITVDGDIAREIFRMRQKYSNYVDILEASYLVIDQIEEEEREKKESKKGK